MVLRSWLSFLLVVFLALEGLPQARFSKSLPNGLTVVYVEDSSRPLLELALAVKAGAQLDGQDSDGVNALWAQVFWKRGADGHRYADYARSIGMHTACRYGLSHTQWELSCLPYRTFDALRLLRVALEDDQYTKQDLSRSLKAYSLVLQDLDTDPHVFLERELGRQLWGERYPEMQVYGSYLTLQKQKPEALRNFHRTLLHPENCLFLATGPEDKDAFFLAVDSMMGSWQSDRPLPYFPQDNFVALPQSNYEVYINELAQAPLLQFSWPLDGTILRPENAHLGRWFVALAQSRRGPFQEALIATGLASRMNWTYVPSRGPGAIHLDLVPDHARLSECLEALRSCLAKFLQVDTFSDSWVQSAQKRLRRSRMVRQDLSRDQLFYAARDWAIGLEEMDTLLALDLEQLQGFVQRCFFEGGHVAGLLLNSVLAGGQDWGLVFRADPLRGVVSAGDSSLDLPDSSEVLLEQEPAARWPWVGQIRIYFEPASFFPDSASRNQLQEFAQLCRTHQELSFYVNGYADGRGNGVYNYQLSIQRAQSVIDLLASRYAVARSQLALRAWGEAFPEFPDDTPANRAKNRRVTFDFKEEAP